ncbi:TPA: hypothetical protein ACGY73_002919 [Stenotrophomonas maltophilia]
MAKQKNTSAQAANAVDQRLLRDHKFRVGREIRGELKQPREEWQHRLIHKIGHLMVDIVEGGEQLGAHDAVKRLQLDADLCCEIVEMDATPVQAPARCWPARCRRSAPSRSSAQRACHSARWNRPGFRSCSTV